MGLAVLALLFGEFLTGLGIPSLTPELRGGALGHSRGQVSAKLAAGSGPLLPELVGALGTAADSGSSPDSLVPVLAHLAQALWHAIRPSVDLLTLELTFMGTAGVQGSTEHVRLQSVQTSHPGRLGDAVPQQLATQLGAALLPTVQPIQPRLQLERSGGCRDRVRGATAWLVACPAGSAFPDQPYPALDRACLLMRTIDLLEIYDTLGLVRQMTLTEDPPSIVWT